MIKWAYLKKLVNVITDVIISQGRIQNFEIRTVHIFKYKAGSLRMLISDNVH